MKWEHLFQMEIQGLCWDNWALPQCGWVRLQRNYLVWLLFSQTYTTCVSSECQHIHQANIEVSAKWKKVSSCVSYCYAVLCTVHVMHSNINTQSLWFSSKELQIVYDTWLCNRKIVPLLLSQLKKRKNNFFTGFRGTTLLKTWLHW